MSARKLSTTSSSQQPFTIEARNVRLSLSEDSVAIHKSGIEFQSPTPFSPWTEMTVALESPEDGRIDCTGVVISSTGNKHTGYQISMVFTGMTKQEQLRLGVMALAAS
jgi:hypothetical protein